MNLANMFKNDVIIDTMNIIDMFECGVRHIIKWGEMMWLFKTLIDGGCSYESTGLYLGEAGNPSYGALSQIYAIRIGNEVLVTSQRRNESHIIPADITIVKGFSDEKDGRTLMQIMAPDRVYDYTLNDISNKPDSFKELVERV